MKYLKTFWNYPWKVKLAIGVLASIATLTFYLIVTLAPVILVLGSLVLLPCWAIWTLLDYFE